MTDSPTIHLTRPRGWLLAFAVAGFAFLAATLVPVQPTVAQGAPAVDIQVSTDGISVDFFATTPRNVLTYSVRVVGPDNFVFEQRVEGGALQWIPPENLADGLYNWEAWVVTADVGAQMRDPSPALKGRAADHWFHEAVKQTHVTSGSFKVENGLLEDAARSRGNTESFPRTRRIAGAILDILVPSIQAQQASFALDAFTIHPDETDAASLQLWESGGTEAWRITNRVDNGNQLETSYLGTVHMTILPVTGNVGINTTSPTNKMQIVHQDFDGLRFSNAIFSETFVIGAGAGDTECCGFYLDNQSGTQMLIDQGAPAHSFVVRLGGNTGMGTAVPAAALHVQRADNTAQVLVHDTGASDPGPGQTMFNLINNGPTKFRMEDTSQADVRWEFRTSGIQDDNERFQMNKLGSGVVEMQVFAGGDVTIAGSLFQASSRTVKEGIVDLNPEEVLTRLNALPVHEWSYQRSPQERHLGPMAEDFHAAFGLGRDSKHISPGDLAGVALAAAKAVNAKLVAETTVLKAESMDKDRRIAELDSTTRVMHADNADLRSRLERLEAMIFDAD